MIDDPEGAEAEQHTKRLLLFVLHLLPPDPDQALIAHEVVCDTWKQFLATEEVGFRDRKAVFRTLCRIASERIRVGTLQG